MRGWVFAASVATAGAMLFGQTGGDAYAQRAGASADLTVDCDGAPLPPNEAAVRACIFKATNTGSEAIAGARFEFQPAPNLAIPDRYYFWEERLDGAPQEFGPADLSYDFGDLAPGQTRTIELRTIVEASRPYGAVAVLWSGDGRELDRELITGEVAREQPPLKFDLLAGPLEPNVTEQRASYAAVIRSVAGDPIRSAEVLVDGGYKWGADTRAGWSCVAHGTDGLYMRCAQRFDGASAALAFDVPLVSAAGICVEPRPVLVATVQVASRIVEIAAFGEQQARCEGSGQGGGEPATTLPAGGDGASLNSTDKRSWTGAAWTILALGLATLGAGAAPTLVGRRRRD